MSGPVNIDALVGQVTAIFPDANRDAVRRSLVANNGDQDATINAILNNTLPKPPTQEETDLELALSLSRSGAPPPTRTNTPPLEDDLAMALRLSAQEPQPTRPPPVASSAPENDDEAVAALPEGTEAMVTHYVPYWYECDQEEDTNWGCGYRCVQMLLEQMKHKGLYKPPNGEIPSILEMISILNGMEVEAEWGRWLAMDSVVRWMSTLGMAFSIYDYDSLDKRRTLITKLTNHFNQHDLLAIVVGGGVIGVLGGIKRTQGTTLLMAIDPHGSPKPFTPEWRWNGGEGWLRFDQLFLESVMDDVAALMQGEELLRNLSWSVLFFYPQPPSTTAATAEAAAPNTTSS